MSAVETTAVDSDSDLPQIYIACPLTALTRDAKRHLKSDVRTVEHAIEAVTVADRVDDERWPVRVYAPIDKTAPWGDDGLTPDQVYRSNLIEVHNSDAVVVVAEKGGSAGIGQELEWAVRLGLPTLYLCPTDPISRQIRGTPGFVRAQSYGGDALTLEANVQSFLRQWRPLILDGPRRRMSKRLRYEVVTRRLRAAWARCADPTLVAAQARVEVRYLELTLSDPVLVASMPTETLVSVSHELGVSLTSQSPAYVVPLPASHLRALMAAAEQTGWPDTQIERLILQGRAAVAVDDAIDLRTAEAWITLAADT